MDIIGHLKTFYLKKENCEFKKFLSEIREMWNLVILIWYKRIGKLKKILSEIRELGILEFLSDIRELGNIKILFEIRKLGN